jgi:tetratricopeptide (TPR) repeat protein
MKSHPFRAFTPCVVLIAALSLVAHAQTDLNLPEASQAAEVKQRIGITDITIKYHRPLVSGRKIWSGVVPLAQVWRAGANENTTIEVGTPVSIEGKPLAAGRYGLHMIPAAEQWTIIFSKMAQAWGSYTYNEAEDALRVSVKARENEMEEALEYEFEDLKPDSVAVTLKWEKLAVPFRVSINEPETVLASIRNELRGRAQYAWNPPNEAAQYCLTKKVALDEALKWADLSIQNEERFENLSTKAEILKALNKADDAKNIWNRALEISTPVQLYSHARQLQAQKRQPEAMEIFQALVKRAPQTVFGLLAQARIKSAAGDFAGAAEAAKQAQAVAISDQQKQNIKALIDRLQARQDINQ